MTRNPFARGFGRDLSWRAMWPEIQGVVGTALPVLNAYAMLWLTAVQGWLPPFASDASLDEIRDPIFLMPVDWAAALALLVGASTAYLIWWPPAGWGFRADHVNTPARRSTLIVLLSLTAIAVVLTRDASFMFLAFPTLALWPWIQPRALSSGRLLNAMLYAGGLLPWLAAVVSLAARLPTPAFVWWHLMAGAAYGLIPGVHIVAWCLLMAVGLRLLRLAWRDAPLSR